MVGTIEERSLAYKVLDGVMLSDGRLFMQQRSRNAAFRISQSGIQHLDWLQSIRLCLSALGVDCPGVKLTKACRRNGEAYDYLYLLSRVSPILTKEYFRWYPHGKKLVPNDLELTPVVLANLFTGDGSSSWRLGNRGVVMSLCVQNFSLEDIERIQSQLDDRGIKMAPNCRRVLTTAGTASILTFMDMVEPYIVPSYRYKIKRPARGTTEIEEDYNEDERPVWRV